MKYSLLATLLFLSQFFFTSCQKANNKNDSANDSIKSLVIGDPLDYGVTNTLIFPVGSNYKPINKYESSNEIDNLKKEIVGFAWNSSDSKNDRLASAEYINKDENSFDIKNILFYDQLTGTTSPLLKDTLHILSFAIHKEFKRPMIFYRIVKHDINNDKQFNSKDAVMLFSSTLRGDSLTQITPENEQFVDYFYYPESQKILTKTFIDRNNDSTYTTSDETNFREVNILNPALGREIFSKSLKDSLRF